MLETLKVWWVILAKIGPLGRTSRQADQWIRYFIVEALDEVGLFDYLEQSRSYGQIVARFGFVDTPFTREVMATLSSSARRLVIEEDGRYRRNPEVPLPSRDELVQRTPEALHKMAFFRDFAQQIPPRMREEPVDFVRHFEEEGPAVLSFDRSLSTKIYAGLREAAFAYVDVRELRGKKLLDLGCGSGYETADIWLRLKGDIQITAVDPARGLLSLAEDQFYEIVSRSGNGRAVELTEANRPSFHLMSAIHLDFPDESFDVVYHSLVLHWLSDPQRGVQEIARVLKPGGLVFGTQYTKPRASPWQNLMFTVHEGVHGVFWEEELRRWYEHVGVYLSIATPAGVFKGRKVVS
jgi:ubiquinone/menaquinone biosynthesis C-methylase UbiE